MSALPTLSWVHANHTYKFGVEYKYDTTNYSSSTNLSPAYSFSTAETAQRYVKRLIFLDMNGRHAILQLNVRGAQVANRNRQGSSASLSSRRRERAVN